MQPMLGREKRKEEREVRKEAREEEEHAFKKEEHAFKMRAMARDELSYMGGDRELRVRPNRI